jgi:hypothetical protein
MGLFSSKPKAKPEPIPMEDRPVHYIRWPICRHRADDECGEPSWDVQVGRSYGITEDTDPALLPSRRGSTKRTLVLLPAGQEGQWVDFQSVDGKPLGAASIPKSQRTWAASDEYRLVYQIWLVVTRTDEDEDDPQYEAVLRLSKKGELQFFDEGDPDAFKF